MKAGASSAEGAPHLIHGWVGAGLVTINPLGFCHRLLARPYNKFIISLIFQFLSLIETFITPYFCSSCILAKFGSSIPLLAGLFLPLITPDFVSAARLPVSKPTLRKQSKCKKNSKKGKAPTTVPPSEAKLLGLLSTNSPGAAGMRGAMQLVGSNKTLPSAPNLAAI